jgi:hypothetical protein
MGHRFVASLAILSVPLAVVAMVSVPVAGQTSGPAKGWVPARTPDGHPNLAGLWTYAAGTPGDVPMEAGGNVRNYAALKEEGFTDKNKGTAKSLVVDPPDGHVPVRPEALKRRDYDLAHIGESWEYLTPWERCITRGIPGSMFPSFESNSYEIWQTPGAVTVFHEMIHDARIIPTDGSPHLPQNVRLWMGDARGHWEGDTLVVETTNFNDKGVIASSGNNGRIRGIHHSEKLRVVERFTLTGPDTIRWEGRIEDPDNYTAPWTVAFNLDRDDRYREFQYECHEGNLTVPYSLEGGTAVEKK